MARMLVVLLGISLWVSGARVAFAQVLLPGIPPAPAHSSAPGPAPRADAVPVPIVPAAIPLRAREAETLLRTARDVLVNRELSRISELLPRLLEDMTEADPPAAVLSSISHRRELRDVLLTWESLSERLSAWQRLLSQQVDSLEHHERTIRTMEQQWSATRQKLEQQSDSPPSARDRTSALLREIAEVQALLSEAGVRLFGLQERVDAARQSLDLRVQLVERTQLRARGQLASAEGMPVWAYFSTATLPPLTVHAEHLTRATRTFWSSYRRRLPLDALLLLLIVAGARLFAQRTKRSAAQQQRQQQRPSALDAPVLSVLLSVLIVARFAYPDVRSAILDLLSLVTLAIFAGLVPHVAQTPLARRIIWSLTAALAAYRVLMLLYLDDPWLGLAMLLLTAPLLGLLFWAMQVDRRRQLNVLGNHLPRATALFLRVAVVGLSVALLAGLFGHHDLLSFLLEGFVFSLQWLLISMALTRVLSAFVEAALGAGRVSRLSSMSRHGSVIRERAQLVVNTLGVGLWFVVTLGGFEVLEPSVEWLGRALSGSTHVGSWDVSFGHFGAFVLTMYLTLLLARTTAFFLDEDILPRMSLARGVPPTISRLSRYAILASGFIFAVGAAGVDMSKVALFASALSVGIGFGMQNLVNNFVSGLMLIFERPVRVGDLVQVGQLIGVVQTIGIRSSTLRTADGAEAILPNSDLIANQVINWTLSDPKRRVDIPVGVAYGTDPARVLSVLTSAVAEVAGVAPFPEPTCLFVGFGDSSLNFELRIWAQRSEDWVLVRSVAAVAVYAKLSEEGIEIPFPQRDLHLRTIDPAAATLQLTQPSAAAVEPSASAGVEPSA